MITAPRDKVHKRAWKEFIKNHDIHKWIVAKETGAGGYEHWQVRLDCSCSFEELKSAFPQAHIEKSTQWCNYERKEGRFVSSDDNNHILSCRYGKLRSNQEKILRTVYANSDREITCVYCPRGNSGKSWLCRHLFEIGKGYYVPPTIRTSQGIIQYVASGYNGEPIIMVDIPRSSKWTPELYESIEAIKDGLVYDTRYSAKMRDIWGVKILVMTNNKPKLNNLSKDRWVLLDSNGRILNEDSLS